MGYNIYALASSNNATLLHLLRVTEAGPGAEVVRSIPCGLLPLLDNLQVPLPLSFCLFFACLLVMTPGIYIQMRCYGTQLNNLPQQAKEC